MKKTTYIMMGMLVATVCLIVGGVAFWSTQGDERVSSLITLKGEEKVLSLPACKYVMVKKEGMHDVEVKPGIVESYHNFVLENDFQLVGTEDSAPALKIASDLEPFIRTELQGDTLVGGEKGLRGGGAGKPQCSSRGRPGFRGTLWVALRVPSALSTSNS